MFYDCFFFFKQKTAYEVRISDWSSDVCSSDLFDAQRQHAVEEAGDRRQVLLEAAVLVGEVEPSVLGEGRKRAAGDAASVERLIELPQRRLGIGALEIVVGKIGRAHV